MWFYIYIELWRIPERVQRALSLIFVEQFLLVVRFFPFYIPFVFHFTYLDN